MSTPKRVLLVGAGHAHLHVAAEAAALRSAGVRTTLIDPGLFWYSGRATGMLGGQFSAADDQIDPRAVIERAGGEFIAGRVEHIDRVARRVYFADGSTHDYDWLSINVGSGVNTQAIEGCADDPTCWPVKPIARLEALHQTLVEAFAAGQTPSLAVIGGGATGCEIAANLAGLARRACDADRKPIIQLLQSGDTLAPALPRGARERLGSHLIGLGVQVKYNAKVTSREHGALVLSDGESLDADHVVLATGLTAPGWLDGLGLAFDDGLVVDKKLRSIDDDRVFAVGDCARIQGHSLPRLGVFGVRQAPVLLANLRAVARGQPMQHYTPQSKWLSILDLGDGTGLATRGERWWQGRASAWLKHWLDRRFIERYRV